MVRSAVVLFLTGVVGACSGCTNPDVDRTKFDATYRAAKAVESAANVGVNYQRFSEVVQAFTTELSIAKDKATSDKERELVSSYTKALDPYRDSLTVWAWKIEHGPVLTSYNDVRLADFMRKYNVTPYATGNWNADKAIQATFAEGAVRLKQANELLTGGRL